MSTIRIIYTEEPKFPATDQHPDAQRFKVGDVWVDALDGRPTQAEIDAVLMPAPSGKHDFAALDATIDNDVTTLAGARAFLKKLVRNFESK